MKQILHIFAKDTRRFWPEILISLAITAAFVCLCPYQWTSTMDERAMTLKTLSALLALLVPISWWILISRIIHAEKLVGDTQFWITRPYTWTNLLTAKLLFLAVFLYLPFFIAQNLLLAEAGFPPQSSIPGLLFILLLATGFIVLPLAALASITSSLARLTLTILGVILSFIALFALTALVFSNQQGMGLSTHVTSRLCFVLAVVGFCAAIELQYSLRNLWLTRTVLIALPFLLYATFYLAARYNQSQVDHIYPFSITQAAPVQLSYPAAPPIHGSSAWQAWPVSSKTRAKVSIPLDESGVAEGYVVFAEGYRAEITAPNGAHWSTDWQFSSLGDKFIAGETHFNINLEVPLAVYSKLQSAPLTVHLTFALTEAQADKVTSIPLPAGAFSIPDFGMCTPKIGRGAVFGDAMGITCLSALRDPPLTYITARWSDAHCSASQSEPGVIGNAWTGSLDREPAQFGISPVNQPQIYLSNDQTGGENNRPRFLCTGTPLTFTQYKAVRRTQVSVGIEKYFLPKMTIAGDHVTVTQ